jgi:hydrogenase nickel incorporation protein HypA/HybF
MHELSLALSIADLVLEEAERQAATRVLRIHLRLGELSGVVAEALHSAYALAREGSLLAEAELLIEMVPVRIHCPRCQAERAVVSIQHLACVECGTFSAAVVAGRELEIIALEVQ